MRQIYCDVTDCCICCGDLYVLLDFPFSFKALFTFSSDGLSCFLWLIAVYLSNDLWGHCEDVFQSVWLDRVLFLCPHVAVMKNDDCSKSEISFRRWNQLHPMKTWPPEDARSTTLHEWVHVCSLAFFREETD